MRPSDGISRCKFNAVGSLHLEDYLCTIIVVHFAVRAEAEAHDFGPELTERPTVQVLEGYINITILGSSSGRWYGLRISQSQI